MAPPSRIRHPCGISAPSAFARADHVSVAVPHPGGDGPSGSPDIADERTGGCGHPCEDRGVSDRPSVGGVSGEFITETFDYDGGRQVTVYVPPDPPEAIVFAGDGQVLTSWAADLEGTAVPASMMVGVHRIADETLRLHEYSPGFDRERFAAHETFLV